MAIRKPFFVVPADLGAIASGNARTGNPVGNLNRFDAFGLTWKTDGDSNVWARGMFAEATDIDFCAVAAANALPDTQIRLRLGTSQAEVDGGSAPYDSTAVDFISPAITSADGLYHSHLELDTAEPAVTWWRIDITDHTGDFEAAAVVLGLKLEPSRFYNFNHESGFEDLGDAEITRHGVIDETPGTVIRTKDFALGWQTREELRTKFNPMVKALGKRGVVYLCFDPEPSVYRQEETYMGLFRKPAFARGIRKPGTFYQEYSIRSFI
jgi:hypothetical protein